MKLQHMLLVKTSENTLESIHIIVLITRGRDLKHPHKSTEPEKKLTPETVSAWRHFFCPRNNQLQYFLFLKL